MHSGNFTGRVSGSELSDLAFLSVYQWLHGHTLNADRVLILADEATACFHTHSTLSGLLFTLAEYAPFWGLWSYEAMCDAGLIRVKGREREQRESREAVLLPYLGVEGIREILTNYRRVYALTE